jgi:predicted nucleic acid-binding protein
VLPEFIVKEATAVLEKRFPDYEIFLNVFLLRAEHTIVPWSQVGQNLYIHQSQVRDAKDAAILTSTIVVKPKFAITGDKTLREDMKHSQEIAGITTICSSAEFLKAISKPI